MAQAQLSQSRVGLWELTSTPGQNSVFQLGGALCPRDPVLPSFCGNTQWQHWEMIFILPNDKVAARAQPVTRDQRPQLRSWG